MTEELLKSFGENIKQLRVNLNMSQDELAEKCGYTDRSSIAKIESGKADIPQKKIKAFADALKVPPGVLLEKKNMSSNKELQNLEIVIEKKSNDEQFLKRMLAYAKLLSENPEA